MKNKLLIYILTLLIIGIYHTPKSFAVTPASPTLEYIEGEVIVKLKTDISESTMDPIAEVIQADVKKKLLLENTFVLKVPEIGAEKVVKILNELPQVEYASLNYKAQSFAITNDESLDKQWALFKIQAANKNGTSAWDKTTGKPEIKVAVLDTGINKNHPDLKAKVSLEKNFTSSPDSTDRNGHGTHIAGIVAAVGNNTSGIAGLAYKTTLINAKVLSDGGDGAYSDIIDGIIWAADSGASVINLSLGGSATIKALEDAVNYAYDKGVVVVAAAGNSGSTNAIYPAYYSNVLSVAATDENDGRLAWSNHGSWVKIAAPGASIYSTYRDSYSFASGTSMASAYASGLAALVWAANVCSTQVCVIDQIEKTADQIQGTGQMWQYGRINALRAMGEITSNTPSPTPTFTPAPTETPALPPAPPTTQTQTPTPTSSVAQNIITASNIEMWSTKRSSRYDIFIKVTVIKQSDASKISNAAVTLDLSTPTGDVYEGVSYTNTNGQVTFALRSVRTLGTYSAQIIDVSKTGHTYSSTKTTSSLVIK